jgi:hypothetical protein
MRLITDDAKGSRNALDVKDQRPDDATIALLQQTLEGARGIVRGLNLSSFGTWLTVVGNLVGSAATAFTTVINLEPDNTGEFSTFAALFDECKVEEAKLEFSFLRSAAGTADTLQSYAGFSYDPIDSTAHSSLAVLAEASQHIIVPLPQLTGVSGSAPTTVLTGTTRTGLHRFSVKMPPGSQLESSGVAAGNVVTGLWSSTAQSNQCYGFIKPYFEAGAASQSWACRYVLYMRVLFRSRT